MEYSVEFKLQKDAYAGGYASGLTMCGSQSVAELTKVSESEKASGDGYKETRR